MLMQFGQPAWDRPEPTHTDEDYHPSPNPVVPDVATAPLDADGSITVQSDPPEWTARLTWHPDTGVTIDPAPIHLASAGAVNAYSAWLTGSLANAAATLDTRHRTALADWETLGLVTASAYFLGAGAEQGFETIWVAPDRTGDNLTFGTPYIVWVAYWPEYWNLGQWACLIYGLEHEGPSVACLAAAGWDDQERFARLARLALTPTDDILIQTALLHPEAMARNRRHCPADDQCA
jgi:hypothetical protein